MISTVCFTGHRVISPARLNVIPARVDRLINILYNRGCRTFLAGGAEGFDTIAAMRVIIFRQAHPDVSLEIVLPYPRKGDAAARFTYEHADRVTCLAKKYYKGAPLDRDKYMVDRADACVAFYTGATTGGTLYTIRCANRKGIPVYSVFPQNSGR